MRGRLSLLVTLVAATGCSDAGYERPGTWKPTGINEQNLRAMLVNPQDAYSGTAPLTSRGDNGSRAVARLLADRRRPLLDASVSRVAPTSGGGADASPAPSSGGTPGASQ